MRQLKRVRPNETRLTLECLESRLALATRIWSGGGGSINWSTPANWGITGTPQSGDDLQFPSTSFLTSNNDISDLSLNSITFTTGFGYTLTGLSVGLFGNIDSNAAGTNRINLDLGFSSGGTALGVATGGTLILGGMLSSIGSVQKINPGELVLANSNTLMGSFDLQGGTLTVGNNNALGTSTLFLSGGTTLQADASARTLANPYRIQATSRITLGGASPLTLTGTGIIGVSVIGVTVTLNVTNSALTTLAGNIQTSSAPNSLVKDGPGALALGGTNTYGGTTVIAGTLLVNGTQSGRAVTVNSGATLGGTGTLGALTSNGGTVSPGVSPGRLTAAGVTLNAASTFRVELNGTAAGTGYDQLNATGAVNLGGSTLNATLGFTPMLGDVFTIVQTPAGLAGTFNGLADAAVFSLAGRTFRINYTAAGVTLTRVQGTTTATLGASTTTPVFGQPVTLTATVTGFPTGGAAPTGTVTFREGGTTLGTGTLNAAGQATVTLSNLSTGVHTIDAVYAGDAEYTGSTTASVAITVARASTTTTLVVTPNPATLGNAVTFTATVAAVAPGVGTPTGTVTFRDGGTSVGTGTLNAAGQATFTTSALTSVTHVLDAVYAGDGNFLGSTSAAVSLLVSSGITTTVLTTSPNPVGLNQALILTATVAAAPPGGGVPTGTVTFMAYPDSSLQGGTTLGTATLANGVATLAVANLPGGCRVLVASYSGSANFQASTSAPVQQTISVSPNQAFVIALYRDVLERDADPLGLTSWVAQLDAGTSRGAVSTAVWVSREHRTLQVGEFYAELLGRSPDAIGLAHWVDTLLAGATELDVVIALLTSAEYTAAYSSSAAYVNSLYQKVLNRPADAMGLVFWTAILENAARDRGAVAYYFLTSAEAYGLAVDDYFNTYLNRNPSQADQTAFLQVLERGSSPVMAAAVVLGSQEYFNNAQVAGCR